MTTKNVLQLILNNLLGIQISHLESQFFFCAHFTKINQFYRAKISEKMGGKLSDFRRTFPGEGKNFLFNVSKFQYFENFLKSFLAENTKIDRSSRQKLFLMILLFHGQISTFPFFL